MLDGFLKYDYLTGALVAIIATLMVFIILILIIFLTDLVAKMLNGNKPQVIDNVSSTPEPVSKLDLNDEDATVAALVASIDYRLKNKTNVKVVSIKEVK